MKKYYFITTLLLVLTLNAFFAGDLISATYDLTGTWNYTLSNNWANGDTGCRPAPDTTGTCEINQTGNTFTLSYTSGVTCNPAESCTFEGTVADDVYTCQTTDIVDEEGGTATSTIEFTASSDRMAAGSGNSVYTHPSGDWECHWGGQIRLTKSGQPNQPVQYTLTVTTQGSGTVTLDPPGDTYDAGTQVQLTAEPESSEAFSGWSGDLSGAANPATLTMDADKRVTAKFTANSDNNSDQSSGDSSDSGDSGGCFISTITSSPIDDQ